MTERTTTTFNTEIHMAGDIAKAADLIEGYANTMGMCVSLSAQTFIYTGGREEGFKVGYIHYPRFPRKNPEEIHEEAKALASYLLHALGQDSYSVVSPFATFWFSRRHD